MERHEESLGCTSRSGVTTRGIVTIWLNTRFPCHRRRRARFRCLTDVPRETYRRVCPDPECRAVWHVERTIFSERPGVRMDKLEWTCERGSREV